ncbi:hypothetical protein NX059_006172 [Plenodomus lindquistii]|nr:hypothetical protein NX059_006172 [Plenodomus lindquistii]
MPSFLAGLLGAVRKGTSKVAASASVTAPAKRRQNELVEGSTTARPAAIQQQVPSPAQATSLVPSPAVSRPKSALCVLPPPVIADQRCEISSQVDFDAEELIAPSRPDSPIPSVTIIKRPGRYSETEYNNMSIGDLRAKARRRELELIEHNKHYLIEVLTIFDDEFDQLYTRNGRSWECVPYSRNAVKYHNAQILAEQAERRRARAELDREKKAARSQGTGQTVVKSIETGSDTVPKQNKTQKVSSHKSRPSTDSGYSTGSMVTSTRPHKAEPAKTIPFGMTTAQASALKAAALKATSSTTTLSQGAQSTAESSRTVLPNAAYPKGKKRALSHNVRKPSQPSKKVKQLAAPKPAASKLATFQATPDKPVPSKAENNKSKKRALPEDVDHAPKSPKKAKLPTTEQEAPRVMKKLQQRRAPSQKEESTRPTKAGKAPLKAAPRPGDDLTRSEVQQDPARNLGGSKGKENEFPREGDAPVQRVVQRASRRVRGQKPVEPRKSFGKRKACVEESSSESEGEDDWIVQDVQERPKKRVNKGISKFLAGR